MPKFVVSLLDNSSNLLCQKVLLGLTQLPGFVDSNILDVSNILDRSSISEDVFDLDSAKELVRNLQATSIQILSFSNIKLSPEVLEFLVPALKETKIHTLYFYRNNLGDDGIKMLSTTLAGTQIQSLYLEDNDIGDEGASALGVMLPQTQVVTLSLRKNLITAKGVKALVDGLQRAKIDALDLSENRMIKTDDTEALTDALQGIKVHTLDFSLCIFRGKDVQALVKGLRGSSVQRLRIQYASVDPVIAETLPELLALTQVNTLDLGYNSLGDVGVTAIFQGLHKTQVSTIYINNNGIESLKDPLLALPGTLIHTLKVWEWAYKSSQLCELISKLHDKYKKMRNDKSHNKINLTELTEYLAGSNVTRVLEVAHPELDVVLKANRERKKNSMIAFGQVASRLGMNAEVVTEVVSWLPEGASSGSASLLASGSAATKAGFDTNAAQTAIHSMNLEQSKLETYARGWEQTGRVLSGETTYLNDESRLLRRIFSHSRGLFFTPEVLGVEIIETPVVPVLK